ncbi:mrnC [Scenedesmus sp. PABB004]|nr:mrnC [Scenedesmus sp. PABB004]
MLPPPPPPQLCVRRHFLEPPKRHALYHAAVAPWITAEGQAAVHDALLGVSPPLLTGGEAALLAAARRAGVRLRARFAGGAGAAEAYRKATALEALVGHLHLTAPDRLDALVAALLPPPGAPRGTPPGSVLGTPLASTDGDGGAD